MKLSRTACYAIHAVVFMAAQGPDQIVIGHRAAKTLGIPEGFLLRILVALSRAHILWSVKGPNGGYRLARSPSDISLLAILEAVDGPIRGLAPLGQDGTEMRLNNKLDAICRQSADQVRKQLDKVRISDLAAKR